MRKFLIITMNLFLILACSKKDGFAPGAALPPVISEAPVISNIQSQSLKTDEVKVISYTVTDANSTLDCSSSVTVSSSNSSVLPTENIVKSGVAPNCILTITPTLNAAGFTNIEISATDGVFSASHLFLAEVISVSFVTISPSDLSVAVNGNQKIMAVAMYSDLSQGDVTTSDLAIWTSDDANIVTVNNTTSKGVVTGVSEDITTINLSYKGLSATSYATAYAVNSLTLSTGSVTGGMGSQVSVKATVQTNSFSFDVSDSVAWTSSSSSVATVSTTGVIQFLSAGNAVITASYAGLTAMVNVTVQPKSLISLAVTMVGGGTSIPVNGMKNVIAIGTYSDSSTENLTNSVIWSSANSSVVSVSNSNPNKGKITALSAGSSQLTATLRNLTGSLLVTVNNVTLSSIAVSPGDTLVSTNSAYQFTATATYSDNSTADVTELVTWASSNTTAATISNNSETKGLVTTFKFPGYRSTNISATLNSVVGATLLGINGSIINSLTITPAISLAVHQAYQLKAYGNLADGGVIDLTQFALWSSSSVSNVSVSNALGSKGVVTGVALGTSTITAQYYVLSGTRIVTTATQSSLTEVGIGLTGNYYTWTGGLPPSPFVPGNKKGTRIDQKINFSWGLGNAPLGLSDQFAVRWTGFYKATAANNYFCTYTDDGIRLWLNGVLVIDHWTDHGALWDCAASSIPLVVGTKYSLVVEYYDNTGGADVHLTRSSVSSADAQNISTRAIPQVDLFPH
jgi:trimeric autotransporter adhesin